MDAQIIARAARSVRHRLDDTGPFTGIALAFVLVGLAFLIAILMSPGAWQWWSAKAVPGSEHGGVVLYSYKGSTYSLDDPSSVATGTRTVYINPSDPSKAVFGVIVAQVSDSIFTGGPFLVAVGSLAAGLVRRRATRRRRALSATRQQGEFGTGLDSAVVARIVAQQKEAGSRGQPVPDADQGAGKGRTYPTVDITPKREFGDRDG